MIDFFFVGDIYVETLKGPATQLKVKKRKGMEQVSLFDEQNDDEASWMSSLFGGQKEEKKKDQPSMSPPPFCLPPFRTCPHSVDPQCLAV